MRDGSVVSSLTIRARARLATFAFGRSGRAGLVALALVSAAGAAMVIVVGSRLTFLHDEWDVVLNRPGLGLHALFAPHNEHLIVLEVVLYKALIPGFGLRTHVPYSAALAIAFVGLGLGVFFFVRVRLGALIAVCCATLLLFMGAAWENLFWSFQVGFVASLAFGVWALVLLEHDSARRNAWACVLLVGSSCFANLGLAFVAAAAVAVFVRHRPRQAWIPGVPALGFAAWWAIEGHTAVSPLSATNVARLPKYVVESAGNGLAALAGVNTRLATSPGSRALWLTGFAVACAMWLWRSRRPLGYLWVVVTPPLAFWVMAGANFVPGREPVASRYQLVSGALLLLVGAEVFRTWRLSWPSVAVATALTALALVAGMHQLKPGYDSFHRHASLAKVDLGALDIMHGHVAPRFRLVARVSHDFFLTRVTAGAYFRESRAHGTPAYTPALIEAAPGAQRRAADDVLIAGYGIRLAMAPPGHARRRCSVPGSTEIALRPGQVTIRNRGHGEARLLLRRFAPPDLARPLGRVAPGASGVIALPRDTARPRWRLRSRPGARLELCV